MRKTLAAISITSLVLAAVLTVVVLNASAEAAAGEATDLASPTAAMSTKAASSLADVADDLLDKLVADGAITPADAEEARDVIDAAHEQFDALDWDAITKQLDLALMRAQTALAATDWETVRGLLEEAFKELEVETSDVDAPDWSSLEKAFDRFKTDFGDLDIEQLRRDVEARLGDIDWDTWSSALSERLEGWDLSDLERLDPSRLEQDFEAKAEEFKRYLENLDWDSIVRQFEGFDF